MTGNTGFSGNALESSSEYIDVDGMTEFIEADEKINGKNTVSTVIKYTSKTADTIDSVHTIYTGAKSIKKDPSKMLPDYTFQKHEVLEKKDMYDKYKSNYRKWQSLYNEYEKDSIVFSNGKKMYKYCSTLVETIENRIEGINPYDPSAKEFIKKSKLYDIFSNGNDILETGQEFVKNVFG